LHFSISREEKLVQRAKLLKVNAGTDPCADIGPVISKEVKTLISVFPRCYCLNATH